MPERPKDECDSPNISVMDDSVHFCRLLPPSACLFLVLCFCGMTIAGLVLIPLVELVPNLVTDLFNCWYVRHLVECESSLFCIKLVERAEKIHTHVVQIT